ncbi:MAG: hypothetical protein AMXMBFR47_23360 [Planctomycetota bacterium]
MRTAYQCVATSEAGFVQQLAVSYLGHGYVFYVTGRIPERKDPAAVDAKLIERYGIGISRWARVRRKRAGLANMHYLRYDRFFVLLATHGEHQFFTEEPHFRDARRDAIRFQGYSISLKKGRDGKLHPSVRIHPEQYRKLKGYLLSIALHRSSEGLGEEFRRVPFQRYAPVRRQLLNLWRIINRIRKVAGIESLQSSSLNLRRSVVRAFDCQPEHRTAQSGDAA